MKARPILFSAPMIRALLDGRKTQTRRIVKPQPHADNRIEWLTNIVGSQPSFAETTPFSCDVRKIRCPYGKPGDLLWCRETWAPRTLGHLPEMDRYARPRYRATEELRPEWGNAWKPSIHMPRWASRLTLRLTDVRVERLQEISRKDALAEGLSFVGDGCTPYGIPGIASTWNGDPRECYRALWEHINGAKSWARNPWVWALTFDVIKANVDAVLKREAA